MQNAIHALNISLFDKSVLNSISLPVHRQANRILAVQRQQILVVDNLVAADLSW